MKLELLPADITVKVLPNFQELEPNRFNQRAKPLYNKLFRDHQSQSSLKPTKVSSKAMEEVSSEQMLVVEQLLIMLFS